MQNKATHLIYPHPKAVHQPHLLKCVQGNSLQKRKQSQPLPPYFLTGQIFNFRNPRRPPTVNILNTRAHGPDLPAITARKGPRMKTQTEKRPSHMLQVPFTWKDPSSVPWSLAKAGCPLQSICDSSRSLFLPFRSVPSPARESREGWAGHMFQSKRREIPT